MKRYETFNNIVDSLNLSQFKRDWYSKHTKLGKIYWTLLFNKYCSTLYIEPQAVKTYQFLFFKPAEMFYWITNHYEDMPIEKLEKLELQDQKEILEKKVVLYKNDLEDVIVELLAENMMKNQNGGSTAEIKLKQFDNRHTHLEKVSSCLLLLIKNSGIQCINDSAIVRDFDLKPSQILKLNLSMDMLAEVDIIYGAIEYMLEYSSRNGFFSTKIEAAGATEALEHALIHNPDLMMNNDKRINYLLSLKYREPGGNQIGSIQKAINRRRKEN